MAQAMLITVIKDKGYPDWKSLARTVFAELAPDSSGDIRSDHIRAWFRHSLGMSKDEAENVLLALYEMGVVMRINKTSTFYHYRLNSNLQ